MNAPKLTAPPTEGFDAKIDELFIALGDAEQAVFDAREVYGKANPKLDGAVTEYKAAINARMAELGKLPVYDI